MTVQWTLTPRDDATVVSLIGYLTGTDIEFVREALSFALTDTSRPIVVDLTALGGWTAAGQTSLGMLLAGIDARHTISLHLAARLTVTDATLRAAFPDAGCTTTDPAR